MVKKIIHDPIFLAGTSELATKEDLQVAQNLLDTPMVHKDGCVGMAANMIGVKKRIIAFYDESGRAPTYTVMLNPEIIKKDGVKYQNVEMQTRIKIYTGWTAQIIQMKSIIVMES